MKRCRTYFVFWVAPEGTRTIFGNLTFSTKSNGGQLVKDAIGKAQEQHPDAIIMNICRLD